MQYEKMTSEELKTMIVDFAEEIRAKTIRYGYSSRHIRIVIPESIRAALGGFTMESYGGFTFSVDYDANLVDDIFVFPVTPDQERLGAFWQLRKFITKWLDKVLPNRL